MRSIDKKNNLKEGDVTILKKSQKLFAEMREPIAGTSRFSRIALARVSNQTLMKSM